MKHGYFLLALSLVPLVVVLVVLTWRKRQQQRQGKAAQEARAAQCLSKVHQGERISPLHSPRYSVSPREQDPLTPGMYVVPAMDITAAGAGGGPVIYHPIDSPTPHILSAGGGNFAGAGASGDWACSAGGSDSSTPASSDTCASSSSSTSGTD